jgi:Domain of unknown function (DUF4232)
MNPRTLLATAAAGLALAGTAVVFSPVTSSAADPTCTAGNLYVVKGRLEGAAGNRYLTVKLTNVGDDACSAGIATKAGFRDFNGPLGTKGAISSGTGLVSIDPGETVKTVIHWTDPAPVPADDCMEATATLVTLRVPSLRHTWRLPLDAQVCTTSAYRPDSEPLAS